MSFDLTCILNIYDTGKLPRRQADNTPLLQCTGTRSAAASCPRIDTTHHQVRPALYNRIAPAKPSPRTQARPRPTPPITRKQTHQSPDPTPQDHQPSHQPSAPPSTLLQQEANKAQHAHHAENRNITTTRAVWQAATTGRWRREAIYRMRIRPRTARCGAGSRGMSGGRRSGHGRRGFSMWRARRRRRGGRGRSMWLRRRGVLVLVTLPLVCLVMTRRVGATALGRLTR